MGTSQVEPERIVVRRDVEPSDGIVVYWMQQAQRAEVNPALEYAIQRASDLGTTLAVLFCVVADYPEASARHFQFMFEGLAEVESSLQRRGIAFEALEGTAADVIGALADRIALLVMDRGYLPLQESWRSDVEDRYPGPIHQVETDVVVPVDLVTDKMETAARTIRPRIHEYLDDFVVDLRTTPLEVTSVAGGDDPVSLSRSAGGHSRIDVSNPSQAVATLGVAAQPAAVEWKGGTSQAKKRLKHFCDEVLGEYDDLRNRYDLEDSCSMLSPHLHFGQISPVEVVRRARASGAPAEHVESFIDEVVVRRELAFNYVLHSGAHDSFSGIPDWARETLEKHADDGRPDVLTAKELEAGETEDEVWNAIMFLIRRDGWVHNQLRMYWGKQILYWTNTPAHAYRTLLELNNRYFLDGRDANSFANVAWCFGRHDQGFQEREIIGKVRPFTDKALKRKGDLAGWLERTSTDR